MAKKSVTDILVKDKKVLLRVDFNVPLKEDQVSDDTRIVAALPTIEYLIKEGAKVILVSHLGRPKGEKNLKYTMEPVAGRLRELLPAANLQLASDVIGPSAKTCIENMKPGEVLLIENVRFHAEEEKNDPAFAKELASLADIFVLDAFGTAHRAHASTAGVAAHIPAVAGLLLKKELDMLGGALEKPSRPFVAILGGAKISDKIGVIRNLLQKADSLIIGGGMANTFIKACGHEVGSSLIDEASIDLAKQLISDAKQKDVKLLLPLDVVVAEEFNNDSKRQTVKVDAIPNACMALDIGPESSALFSEVIKEAKTIIWNGPMGVFEMPNFAEGTRAIAQACADAEATTIIGGGDSAAAVKQMGFADKVDHISTGGGASLEFLEGIDLPGVAALLEA